MPYIEMLGQQMGAQAAGNMLNEGMGLLLAGPKRQAQLKTAKGLQQLEITGQKEMTDYNMAKQLQMWKDTNYPAQMEMLKQAGLNPGLIYGMGGGGGATTGQAAGNVTGQQAHEPQAAKGGEGMGLMIGQMGLLEAQKENIKANTEKTKVETAKTAGVDTEKVKAETASLAQGVQNLQAQEALTKVETELKQVQTTLAKETLEDSIQSIDNLAKKGLEEITALRIENDLSKEQYKDKVKMLKLELSHIALQNALTKAQTANIQQDTKLKIQKILESEHLMKFWANQIALGWGRLDHEQFDDAAKNLNMEKDEIQKVLDFLPGIILGPLGKSGGGNPVRGFHKR